MQVIATLKGYYGKIREPGETFTLADEKHFSERWMKAPAAKGKASMDKAEDASKADADKPAAKGKAEK